MHNLHVPHQAETHSLVGNMHRLPVRVRGLNHGAQISHNAALQWCDWLRGGCVLLGLVSNDGGGMESAARR